MAAEHELHASGHQAAIPLLRSISVMCVSASSSPPHEWSPPQKHCSVTEHQSRPHLSHSSQTLLAPPSRALHPADMYGGGDSGGGVAGGGGGLVVGVGGLKGGDPGGGMLGGGGVDGGGFEGKIGGGGEGGGEGGGGDGGSAGGEGGESCRSHREPDQPSRQVQVPSSPEQLTLPSPFISVPFRSQSQASQVLLP